MRRCPSTGRALGGDTRLIGQLIDKRYRVVRLLGDGPFGAVYKAEHVTVGRYVALRILPPALLEHPVALHRFFHEARLMSSVSHRRLQPMLDAGLSAEGVAYVAYQYVRGRSLAAALASEAPLAVEKAVLLVAQVLEGLEAIHQSGFVHRALSPDSVLMQVTASGIEQALLTNFGAAALEERSTDTLATATAPPPTIFVPAPYVPPERKKGAPPDRREDIYAAGVMLAACLSPAGVPRYGGDLLAARVPATIEAVVARATSASVGARYASASEMRACLTPFAVLEEDEPASATKTHISDLRALSRRERALGTLPSRLRLGSDGALAIADREICGPIARALVAMLPPRLSRELDQRVPALLALADRTRTEPVPLVVLAAALEEADAIGGANDRLFCSTVGERAGRDELVARMLASQRGITPEFFLDQIATEWAHRLGHGVCRTSQVGRGYGRIEVRDQEEPCLAVCSCLTGLFAEALTALGGRGVEINKTACESVGDSACVYSATWS